MDQKKKKIYYIVIAASIALSAGIIFYSSNSAPEIEPLPPVTARQETANRTADPSKKVYPVPAVFPIDTKFDDSIFESSSFKVLTPGTSNVITPQDLGRENPFTAY